MTRDVTLLVPPRHVGRLSVWRVTTNAVEQTGLGEAVEAARRVSFGNFKTTPGRLTSDSTRNVESSGGAPIASSSTPHTPRSATRFSGCPPQPIVQNTKRKRVNWTPSTVSQWTVHETGFRSVHFPAEHDRYRPPRSIPENELGVRVLNV